VSGRSVLSGAMQRQVLGEMRRLTRQRLTRQRGTRKRIAHECGVSLSTFNDIMVGRRPPSLRVAMGLGLVALAESAAATPGAEGEAVWKKDQLTLELQAE